MSVPSRQELKRQLADEKRPIAGEHGDGPDRRLSVGWLPHIETLVSLFGSRAAAYERAGMTVRGTGKKLPRTTDAA